MNGERDFFFQLALRKALTVLRVSQGGGGIPRNGVLHPIFNVFQPVARLMDDHR